MTDLALLSPPAEIAVSKRTRQPDEQRQRTLRVLHVVNGEHYAGAERVQDLLAVELPDVGVEVAFACVKPGRFGSMRRSQSTRLVELPMRSRFDLRPAWKLARLIRREKFDLIHTHTPRSALVGHLAARLAGVPMVHHVHGHTATEVGQTFRARLNAKIEKHCLSRAAAVIAVSATAAKYIREWGIPSNRVHLVPNGVPVREKLAHRLTPRSAWTIGAIALFRPRKGLEVLLDAIAKLHRDNFSVRLAIVGGFETPEYENESRQTAQRLGIQSLVEWRGFQRDINAQLDTLDLLVLPSVLPEGMPMVLLEALAAGVPPIGSRVDGIIDVIRHGQNGLLFEPGNADSLAAEIASVIERQIDWQRLRRNAIASHAERFSDCRMAEGVARVYRSILS